MKTPLIASAIGIGIVIVISLVMFGNNQENSIMSENVVPLQAKPTYSTPISVAKSMTESQPAANVAIDDNEKLYVLYQDTMNGITNLYLKTSVDTGVSFSEPVRVNSVEGDVTLDGRVAPSIEIGANGEIYVLWTNSKTEPNLFMGVYRNLLFTKSIDGGKTFLPASKIAENELPSGKFFQSMSLSEDGSIHMAWLDSPVIKNGTGYLMKDKSRPSTVKYTKSIDGGVSFSQTISLDENPCPCCNVQVTSSENNVHVSWRKVFGEGETQVRDMVIATSNDNGETFSNPVKIHEDNFNFDGCVHVGAPMDVDSKGNLHVVWYTGKNDSPGMYYAISSDHGKTFSEPLSVLTSDWIPPQRVYLSVDDSDIVWLTWEDATGHSANEKMWRYGETKAMIYGAQIKDGKITKFETPISTDEGKSPAIASSKNNVAVVWTSNDNSIMCSTIKNKI